MSENGKIVEEIVGELNNSNSQDALKRNLDPEDVKLTKSLNQMMVLLTYISMEKKNQQKWISY